ncbi:MAG: Ig-like domain-containing protein [Fidelibacterota bacterium]
MIWSSVNENNELDERIFEFPPELLTAGEHQLHDGLDPGLQDGRRYDLTLSYVDPAGNEGEEIHIVDLAYDAGPPVIDILAPDSDTIVREARFEISLSEPVVSLGIRISGEGYETYSETVDSLITSETFYYASCFDRVPVREGVPWTMSLTATDKAGNVSEPVVAESITLDITPPEITIVSPAERTRLNTFKVSYINSETLLHGQMVAIDAEGDSSLLQLEGDLLESGEHLLTSWTPQIEDDVPFSLTITGEDPAGHSTESNRIEHLRFDRSRPVVAIMEPVSHAIQSSFQVRYSVSENLESGVIIILNSAERDSQEVRLADDDLKKGEHTIDALESRVTLLESGNYDVVLFGLDYAGNPSDTVQVSEIRLDQTAPVIEFLTPAPDTVYREVTVRYRLSEPLVEGSLLIVPKSSASTNDSTHVIPLPPEGLRGTDAFELALDEEYELQDGGEYQLQITGKDFAGNDALPVKVMGVKIDRTAPDISITEPEDSRVYSRLPLAYSLSENIKTGKIIITQASPGGHATTTEIDLADEYLLAGDHEITTVEQELTLSENDELSFQITCQDYAGNEGQSLSVTNIRYDNSPPVLSVSRPQPDAIQSSLAFTMTASERLMEMRFTLAQNGGTPDQDSPYSFTAREDELEETTWVLQRFSNTPSLKDNIPYTITIQAIDVAGNESEAVIIENIQLDTSPPEYTLSQPVDGEWIADLFISYTISENIANGQVIFKWENGTPDPVNTHMAELTGEALFQGPHEGIHLTFDTPVVDGAKYSVQLAGTDRAGNELRGQEIHGVLYDATPPVLSFLHPPTGAFVNDFMITYSSSEKLSLAKVQVEIHGEDVITAELGNTSRKGGENFFRLTDYIDIVDGQTVDITLKGVDLAGNETVTDPLTNISLDKTTPECVITAPEDGGHVQRLFLNFSISEPLDSLSMTVERTAGKADDNTPAQALIPVYLIKPDEMSILDVEDYIPLNDGTEYRITLSGSDRAGNAFYPVSVSNVLLDKTPPDITVKFPKPGSFSKKKKFEFDLSEELSSATMTWIWTDGREDAVGVHRMAFPEDLLSAGSHTSTILDSIPHVSEAIYNFSLHLVDRAGNTRDINIPDISYDYDAPKLFAHTPKSGQRIDKVKIKFGCNERLKIGRITIVDLVSNEAQLYLIPRDKLDAREYVIGEVVGKLSMVDSHIYQIRAFGMDLAGNRDEIVIADSVIFDTKPPVITDIRPRQNGRTNSSAVTFTLNEPCARGQLIWLRVSGRADPGSPHVIDIPPQYLKQGENSTIALPPAPLVEGAVYSIAISATDLLGNESRKFNVPNITMDMKGPDLIIINPKPSSTSPITAIQIAFSEPLKSARLEIIATGGNPDPNAPYTIDVAENLIKVPREDGVRITGLPALVTGSIYSIALTGIDMAGNPGDITTVEDVMKE